ncbi:MAG: sulfatase-like hydrolase/transferase, partial [Gemmatimonadetes bacterium]|nr:sulfatase-like hydrolase/transferase [Gemmatimonadota bacterium]
MRSLTLASAGLPVVASAPAPRRPNVILIMTDDQGYGDLSLHGNPHLKTPNLDSLAKQGVEFTRFYVSPVCAPTRASLLTGRYNLRCGVHGVTAGMETMRAEETTLAEALRSAGYRTALYGKWHLGEHYPYVPHAQGFDDYIGFRNGHWN